MDPRTFLKLNVLCSNIPHILRRNCLLKQVIEGKIRGRWKWQEDEEEDVRSYWMTLRTGEDTPFEGGSSRSHYVEESFWRRLWTCRQTEY